MKKPMKTLKEWKDFCHKEGSAGLIYVGHDVMDAVFDILDDWEQSEKNSSRKSNSKRTKSN